MKKFLFLSYGFEQPTPEIMKAWGAWFGLIGDRIVEQNGIGPGRQFTKDGDKALSKDTGAATGYVIFTAESLEEAEGLARQCPVIDSNIVHEIMPMGGC